MEKNIILDAEVIEDEKKGFTYINVKRNNSDEYVPVYVEDMNKVTFTQMVPEDCAALSVLVLAKYETEMDKVSVFLRYLNCVQKYEKLANSQITSVSIGSDTTTHYDEAHGKDISYDTKNSYIKVLLDNKEAVTIYSEMSDGLDNGTCDITPMPKEKIETVKRMAYDKYSSQEEIDILNNYLDSAIILEEKSYQKKTSTLDEAKRLFKEKKTISYDDYDEDDVFNIPFL